MKKIVLTLILISVIISWTSVVIAQTSANGEPEQNQFAAIILMVSEKENQYEIKQVKSRLTEGVYKEEFANLSEGKENDLACFILNERKETVDTIFINNPLSIRLEYPNEDGTIGSTIDRKTENEIFIRFNYTSEMRFLLFKKFNREGQLTTIITLPLNFK